MSEIESIKISIITVTLNCREYVERTINSVVNNSYHNLEYIIIDGGSTDGTVEIIEKHIEDISCFITEKDNGISEAFNKGIRVSTGTLVGIVNAGDILDVGILSKIASVYDESIDIYRCKEWSLDVTGKNRLLLCPTLDYSCLPIFFHPCHMGCYIKTSELKKNNYRTDYKISMDVELLYRLNRKGCCEIRVDGIVGEFFRGGVSSKNIKQGNMELIRIERENDFSRSKILLSVLFLFFKGILRKLGIKQLLYKIKAVKQ